jgi:glycosyltransferase involved in cell wall biosynthesis
LAKRKRLGLLVSAFARIASRFPAASLLMVGPDEGWESRLRSQSRSLGLEGRVTFTGLLSDEDKLAALEAATLFVSPGIGEGFPIAVLEAMACRLPVVVNESVPEIAPSEAAILVPAQEGALAEAMAALLEDGPRRARMGARGRELVATHYTWTRIAARLDDIYRRVVEEAGGRIAGSSEC